MAFIPDADIQAPASTGSLGFVPDFPESAAPMPATPEPQRGFLDKAAGVATSIFPGTRAIGEGLGTAAYNVGQLAKGRNPFTGPSAEASQVNVPKMAGGILQAGSTVAGLAAPLPKAAGFLASAGKAALQTGALSSVAGAGNALQEGGGVGDVAKSAFISGLTGAVVGGAVGGAVYGIGRFAQRAPQAVYNNALKIGQKLKDAGKSPASFLNDEKVWGSLGSFKKAATTGMNEENAVIKQAAVNTPGGILWEDIRKQAVENLAKDYSDLYTPKQLEALVDSVPVARLKTDEVVPWVDADGVRSKLGSFIGDTKWMQENPTQTTRAAESVYHALSDAVKKATGTKDSFARLSQWLQTSKVVDKAIGKADSRYGLGLYDYISGVGGAAAGFSKDGDTGERIKNAALYGGLTLGAERLATNPTIQTGIVQALSKLPTDAMGRVSRDAVVQLIGSLTGKTSQ